MHFISPNGIKRFGKHHVRIPVYYACSITVTGRHMFVFWSPWMTRNYASVKWEGTRRRRRSYFGHLPNLNNHATNKRVASGKRLPLQLVRRVYLEAEFIQSAVYIVLLLSLLLLARRRAITCHLDVFYGFVFWALFYKPESRRLSAEEPLCSLCGQLGPVWTGRYIGITCRGLLDPSPEGI